MPRHEVIYVATMRDSRISSIADDCMFQVAPGIKFHNRLQLLIVVEEELVNNVGNYLPFGT